MTIDLQQFRSAFFEESVEHLATIENGLLRLESRPHDSDLLNEIFRAAHSVKGASGMFGLHDLAHFTHAFESVLDRLRHNTLPVTIARVNLLLRASDMLHVLVDCARNNELAPAQAAELTAQLAAETDGAVIETSAVSAVQSPSGKQEFRITMRPARELLLRGQDPTLLLRELAQLGEIVAVSADTTMLPELPVLDAEACYLAWTIVLATERAEADIRDVFMFVDDICEVVIERVSSPGSEAIGSVDIAAIAPLAADVISDVAASTPARAERRTTNDRRSSQSDSSSIRVSTEKVDELINLVGELVISHSMVNQLVSLLPTEHSLRLEEAVAEMGRNMRDVQERMLKVRMLPISSVFHRFPRLVRDIAMSTGKPISLVMSGEDTELDKSVIERIADPLTHLLRNAADHGIESPDARRAAGKPEEGTITLAASHRGGNVVLEISDDGPGLNLKRIREKGIAVGLLRPDEVVSDEQLQQLIFQAGFSTSATITDVSGRGVGMDVVRRNVESLSGSISIESQPGFGTKFIIKLPLTLAILDGMALAVGEQVFVMPLLAIVESFRATPAQVTMVMSQGEVVQARGETVPLVRLHRILGIPNAVENPARALIVLIEHDGRRFGLMVDDLLGQSQVVIRNLEANFRRVDGVMGATIMGDGRVALILDVQGITRLGGRSATRTTGAPVALPELTEAAYAVA